MYENKGAFIGCTWCHGKGCLACPQQRAAHEKELYKPIFTAKLDCPEDMERMKRVVGIESINHAFGPDGGGIQEIKEKAAVESILQLLSKR